MRDRDPKRLRELAPPGSALGRGLTAARGRGPSEAELRALGAAVLGASATGMAATATKVAGKAGATAVRLAGLTKATVALAVAGTIAGTAGVAWHHRHRGPSSDGARALSAPAPAEEPGPRPDMVPLAPVAAGTPAVERPALHLERRRVAAAPLAARPQPAPPAVETPPPALPPAQVATDADEELRLIGAAQRALPRDPALALALAREHGRRFPDGVLAQERDAVSVSALWETGRRDEARERARRFLDQHPGSTYVARMREVLRQAESPAR